MKLRIHKMQACGNDFIFLDYMHHEPPPFYPKEVQFLCDRHFGVGADGLVILTNGEEHHARWTFYNADGSEAEMCGNAARCAIRYLWDNYYQTEPLITIATKKGIVKGRPLEGTRNIELALFPKPDEGFKYDTKYIKTEHHTFDLTEINTGVPHAVIEVKDIFAYPIIQVGKELRHHAIFGPEGTNVTFFQKLVGKRIRATTFERGVEWETMACGTGVAAAAITFGLNYLQPFPIEVVTPGGEIIVDLSPVSSWVLLQGPAELVFTMDLEEMPNSFERPLLFSENRKGRA